MSVVGLIVLASLGSYWGSEWWGLLGGAVGFVVGAVLALLAAAVGELRLIRKALVVREER